jgi:hypothetical protein
MCRNVWSIEWHQKTYHEISWDYPFKFIYNFLAYVIGLIWLQNLIQKRGEILDEGAFLFSHRPLPDLQKLNIR